MFYQPKKVSEMWDTWLYYHEGIHYLYYLHKSAGTVWDGMSVASSTDGVHYEEIGPIIHKRDDAEWLGTGSVWRAGDKFILNFSESREGIQAIFFAASDDLVHWERLGDELRSDPDPKWYDDKRTGRWDCIWAIQRPEGGFLGYLTARPWNKTPGIRFESVGKVESEDGVHWHASSPPVLDWGEWPRMNVGEVGAIEKIGDRYYLMLGYSEGGLGGRQLLTNPTGSAWGMYSFVGDSPDGPFMPVKQAYRLLVSNGTYFSRFYPTPNGMLVNHHSIEAFREGPGVWMAPLKKAIVDTDGCLRLGYWSGNDQVKGKEIDINLASTNRAFPVDEIGWSATSSRLEINEPIRGCITFLDNSFDIQQGIILEGFMEIHEPPKRWSGIGVYVEHNAEQHKGTGVMLETRGFTEIATMDERGGFTPVYRADVGVENRKKHAFRLLLRRTMIEFYLDDLLIQCYSLPEKPTGRIGLILESGKAIFEDLKAWVMNL